MSSGGQTSTQTSNSQPWSGQQPYLSNVFQQAQNNYNSSNPQYYPGQTVANQSPATQAYQSGTIARATNGSPLNAAAGNYDMQAMQGGGMNPIFQNVASQVLPAVSSQFSLAGRYGSPDQAGTTATALTNAYSPFALQNAQFGASQAPQIANQDYQDLGQLQQAGAQQDAYGQNLVNANVNHWNFDQNLPANKLAQLSGIVQGGQWGTSGTSTQTQPTSALGGLGGILSSIL